MLTSTVYSRDGWPVVVVKVDDPRAEYDGLSLTCSTNTALSVVVVSPGIYVTCSAQHQGVDITTLDLQWLFVEHDFNQDG